MNGAFPSPQRKGAGVWLLRLFSRFGMRLPGVSRGERRSYGLTVLAVFGLALFSFGCAKEAQTKTKIEDLSFTGLPVNTEDEIREGLSSRQAEKFIGIFERDYEGLDQAALEKDLERIERSLRRRGYYEAKVRAARIRRLDEKSVAIEIEVDPKDPIIVNKVTTSGLSDPNLDLEVAEKALDAFQLKEGDLFDEDAYQAAQVDIANTLADHGYAFVSVEGKATVDLPSHHADVSFLVHLGPKATLGEIKVIGLNEIPLGPVLDTIQLKKGATYSRKEIEEARSALLQLGVFSSVEVEADTRAPDSGTVPLTFRVGEAPLRSISAGLGASIDVLRLAATAKATWTDKNFLGGLRTLTISDRPELTFFPTRIDNLTWPTSVLPQNYLSARLEQPSFLEGRTRGFVETAFNVYPLLYPLPASANADETKVIGYLEVPSAVGLERNFFGRLIPVTLSYNYRYNEPFVYQPKVLDGEKVLPGILPLVVTYPELQIALDLRDDPFQPTKGLWLSLGVQTALPVLGSTISDLRLRPEARAFWPINRSRSLILAVRGTFGFLFTNGYGDTLDDQVPDADDQHKMMFRAFYSGGPDSNRGYPYQRIGPQGDITFLRPESVNCDPPSGEVPPECTLPLGGRYLWEASVELRWKFADPWSFVLFADTSDVSINTMRFQSPHLSVGPGLRYGSPVGPIRLDLGYRVPGAQSTPEAGEPQDISTVAPYNQQGTLPFALHILIGEAF